MRGILAPGVQGFAAAPSDIQPLLNGLSKFGGSAAQFRAHSPLPKNTQEVIDNAILRVGRTRLTFMSDLLDTVPYPLPGWLGIPSITSHTLAEAGAAKMSFVPGARGERQVQQLDTYSLPLPMVYEDFSFDIRELLAAQRVGYGLDTTHIEQATRNVNEFLEDLALNGTTQKFNGLSIYGVLNAPNAQTYTYTGGGTNAWDNASKTGSQILTDVMAMIQKAIDHKYYGPYRLYIPTAYGLALAKEYTTNYPRTIQERLLQIPGLQSITVCDMLPANKTVLIQLTSNVVDVVVGQTPTYFSWATPGLPGAPEWGRQFLVMACVVPRFKTDANSKSGIVIGYTS